MPAKERRVLLTMWAAEAWEEITTAEKYKDTIEKAFNGSGANVTIDGSDDGLSVKLRGSQLLRFSSFSHFEHF